MENSETHALDGSPLPVSEHVHGGTEAVNDESAAVGASESRVVEVQFRRAATGLAAALAANAQGFLAGTVAGATGPGGTAVQSVLLRNNLEESASSFADTYVKADVQRLAALGGAMAPDPLAGLPLLQSFVRLQFPTPEAAVRASRELMLLPDVEKAVVLPRAAPPVLTPLPTDPFIGTPELGINTLPGTEYQPQWYLHRTSVPAAWALGARGAGVVVADIDWGFRTSHEELATRVEMENAFNSFNRSKTVSAGNEVAHGTAVLGIVGAAANGRGIAGYAPEAALWPIQGESGTGISSQCGWANAIEHVRRADARGRRKVIILEVQSVAGYNYEQMPAVNAAIRWAIAHDVVVCVPAGNGGYAADLADDGVNRIEPTGSILVGATEWDPVVDRRASFSNWGARIVVSAPGAMGCDVTCADSADDRYTNEFGGTSSAVAKVAGVAALMLSVNPHLSHHDVREILRGTGTEIVPDPAAPEKRIGVFLDAEAAVREALRRRGINARIEGLARQAPSGRRRSTEPALPPVPVPGAVGPPASDRTLREFRKSTEGVMTREEQLLAVDQAIQLLELFYVHRPLKEAMHAVRPIQRLRVLRRRLEEEPGAWTARQELRLHNLLTDVFISVRDLHTNYLLPQPYRDYTAFLPFLVRPYCDPDGRTLYMVTRVLPGFAFPDPYFKSGVEVLSWNGVDIEAAVNLTAQQTAGSNLAARYVRGVDALTVRPMNVALPPEADWVYVTFRCDDGAVREMRQDWLVRFTPLEDPDNSVGRGERDHILEGALGGAAPSDEEVLGTEAAPSVRPIQEETAFSLDAGAVAFDTMREILFTPAEAPKAHGPAAAAGHDYPRSLAGLAPQVLEYQASLGIDVAADAVREVKELLFRPERVAAAGDGARGDTPDADSSKGEVATHMPLVFHARLLDVAGRKRAYIRIRTFSVLDPDALVREFIRLLELLPQDGLILDVRGNGGGHIFAAERLLQTLTPGPVEPERVQFISTTGTLELCRRNETSAIDLSPWKGSLEQAVLTASTYSQALPITDPASCNQIGQRYQGPVVLLVDARCYSATDIFAAGFEDHRIGVIVGTSETTGAGGANVWSHDLLHLLYSGDGSPLRPLPHRMGMRIAIRQTLRVGPRAGTLLEDFGVAPERVHRTTRRDLLDDDADLLAFAAGVLSAQTVHCLALTETGRSEEKVQFRVDAQGVDRLDFYLNGHPATSVGITPGEPPTSFGVSPGTHLELRGFAADHGPQKVRWVSTLKRVIS